MRLSSRSRAEVRTAGWERRGPRLPCRDVLSRTRTSRRSPASLPRWWLSPPLERLPLPPARRAARPARSCTAPRQDCIDSHRRPVSAQACTPRTHTRERPLSTARAAGRLNDCRAMTSGLAGAWERQRGSRNQNHTGCVQHTVDVTSRRSVVRVHGSLSAMMMRGRTGRGCTRRRAYTTRAGCRTRPATYSGTPLGAYSLEALANAAQR